MSYILYLNIIYDIHIPLCECTRIYNTSRIVETEKTEMRHTTLTFVRCYQFRYRIPVMIYYIAAYYI